LNFKGAKMNHPESKLQSACMTWFNLQYSNIAPLCFAVPSGGFRKPIEAKILKGQGVKPGVSDVILLIPNGQYSSLCIEFKVGNGKQSPYQKSWQEAAEKHGNKYIIIRSFDEFRSEVESYLRQKE
jgi:hypothetical protein